MSDKVSDIEKQAEQMAIMSSISHPWTPAELVEMGMVEGWDGEVDGNVY